MERDGSRAGVSLEARGAVAVLWLRRAGRLNALDDAAVDELVRLLGGLSRRGFRALVLAGEGGRAFCAGYDLDAIDPAQPAEEPLPDERFGRAVEALLAQPLPAVAALEGDAWGGGLDLALACDLRVGWPGLRLALTPVRLGLVYSPQGLARLQSRLGMALARRLLLLAEPLPGEEAWRLGLLDLLVPKERVFAEALALGRRLAARPPRALRETRRLLLALERGGVEGDERAARLAALRSPELATSLALFRERGRRGRSMS